MHKNKSIRVSEESLNEFREIAKKCKTTQAIVFEQMVKDFIRNQKKGVNKLATN